MGEAGISIDRNKCNFCGRCSLACPTDAWETKPGYLLSFGGLFGNRISKGEAIVPFVEDKETLFRICDAALAFFDEHANPGERFRYTIERVGMEKLEKDIREAYGNTSSE